MFVQTKRPKPTSVKDSPFATIYQQEEQKARDQVNLRPDDLEGIIVPTYARPTSSACMWKGSKSVVDDTAARRWANVNKDKARVQKAKHLNKTELAQLKHFPKGAHETFKKKEAERARAERMADRAKFETAVDVHLTNIRGLIAKEQARDEADRNEVSLRRLHFKNKCWKRLKYGAIETQARVDGDDVARFGNDMVKTWKEKKGASTTYLVPKFAKTLQGRMDWTWQYIPA